MKTTLTKTAAILALIIGGLAVFAGGQALLGRDPGYYVINWLLLYNYTVGILTVCVTAILIWTNHRLALPAAIGTFGRARAGYARPPGGLPWDRCAG